MALALMLVSTLTFANNVEVETIEYNVTIENVLSLDNVSLEEVTLEEDAMDCGFPVYWDDGGSGDWGGTGSFWMDCDDSTTMGDILDVLLALFF